MKARLLLIAAVLFAGAAWSQGKVTGKVTDRASGEGLPGVAVVVAGQGRCVYQCRWNVLGFSKCCE